MKIGNLGARNVNRPRSKVDWRPKPGHILSFTTWRQLGLAIWSQGFFSSSDTPAGRFEFCIELTC